MSKNTESKNTITSISSDEASRNEFFISKAVNFVKLLKHIYDNFADEKTEELEHELEQSLLIDIKQLEEKTVSFRALAAMGDTTWALKRLLSQYHVDYERLSSSDKDLLHRYLTFFITEL